jgi:hypothetical protein
MKFLQQTSNAIGVLGANPVQFEAITYKNNDLAEVRGDIGNQGFDPCIELLLGQFLRQLIDAGLPQIITENGR